MFIHLITAGLVMGSYLGGPLSALTGISAAAGLFGAGVGAGMGLFGRNSD